jgi:hypothetical protein
MNMVDGDASSSSSSSSSDEDDDDDDGAIATSTTPGPPPAPLAATTTATTATTRTKDASKEDDAAADTDTRSPNFESPTQTYESPSPIIGTVGTAGGTSSGRYSSLTAETTAVEVWAVLLSGEKRKAKKAFFANKAKKPKPRTKRSHTSLHENDDVDGNSWQVLMLDIRHQEVDFQQEKWLSQKEQKLMELQLQQEKWRSESKQHNLDYKFHLMVKYKKLQEEGFDNHQIVKMVPDMRPNIDTLNMPVHLQLSTPPEEHEAYTEA